MSTPMNISGAGGVAPPPAAAAAAPRAADEPASDVTLLLHPLVVINISDHFNRFAAMRLFPGRAAAPGLEHPPPPTLTDPAGAIRVVGLLLGAQSGREVDICHSIELPARANGADGSATDVDTVFIQTRVEQYKQIFPNYHVVGWYATGAAVTDDDLRLHTDIFSVLNESPFLLLMNVDACTSSLAGRLGGAGPSALAAAASAPAAPAAGAITMYQAELHVAAGGARTLLAPLPHRFASADSERIAVDHVSRHAVPGGADGSATQHLSTLRRSVQMLNARVDVLLRFLAATQAGEVPVDRPLLRRVAAVCARLPSVETPEFAAAFCHEQTDAVAVTYLCGLTKSVCVMNELVDNFLRAGYEKSGAVGARRRI
jgi:COP9 signalosome complex subunit 6